MVTTKDITALDFDTIDEYYDYIHESYINGQIKQAKELTAKLSAEQKAECMDFLNTAFYYDGMDNADSEDVDDVEYTFFKIVGLLR